MIPCNYTNEGSSSMQGFILTLCSIHGTTIYISPMVLYEQNMIDPTKAIKDYIPEALYGFGSYHKSHRIRNTLLSRNRFL